MKYCANTETLIQNMLKRGAKMPSVSKKQADFMRAAAHNAKFAKKAGIPQAVAEEFEKADEAKKGKKSYKSMIKNRYKEE